MGYDINILLCQYHTYVVMIIMLLLLFRIHVHFIFAQSIITGGYTNERKNTFNSSSRNQAYLQIMCFILINIHAYVCICVKRYADICVCSCVSIYANIIVVGIIYNYIKLKGKYFVAKYLRAINYEICRSCIYHIHIYIHRYVSEL